MSGLWGSRSFWAGLVLVVGGAVGWLAGSAAGAGGLTTGGFLVLLGGLAVWGGRFWYYLTDSTGKSVEPRDEDR